MSESQTQDTETQNEEVTDFDINNKKIEGATSVQVLRSFFEGAIDNHHLKDEKTDSSPRKIKKAVTPRSNSLKPAILYRSITSEGINMVRDKSKRTEDVKKAEIKLVPRIEVEDTRNNNNNGLSGVYEATIAYHKAKNQDLEELVASLRLENATLKEQLSKKDSKILHLTNQLQQVENQLKSHNNESSAPHISTSLSSSVKEVKEVKDNVKDFKESRDKDQRNNVTVERVSIKDVVGENKAVEKKIQKIQKEGLIDFDIQTLVRNKQPLLLKKQEYNHRERIVTEILTSEQSYLLGLQILVKVYMEPLLQLAKRDNRFSENDVTTVFGNIETILYINTKICDELEKKLDEWDNETTIIGDLFCEWAPKLKPYCRFGSFYEESLQMIELKKDSNPFKKVLDELDLLVWNFNQTNFKNYFITPVQRIPRYCLLLRDLHKSTPETHPDYIPLSNAITKMEEMAQSLNEQIRKSELEINLFKILERGGGFDRLLTNPKPPKGKRAWKKDGEVLGLICLNDLKRGKNKQPELLLFNDILVASNFVSKRVPCQDYYQPLHLLWLSLNVREEAKKNVENTSLFENAMTIRGPEGEWLIGFESASVREQWSKLIIELIPDIPKPPTKELLEKGIRDGMFEYKTKGVYIGQWEYGYPQGIGKLKNKDGWKFKGHWDHNLRAGFGVVTKPNKETLEAGWRDENTHIKMIDPALWANSELTERDWQLMLTGAQVVKMKANERFIEQGKPSTKLYKVKSGKLRIEKGIDPEAPKKVLAILETNSVVGDTSVISFFSMATADVYAHTDTELDMISIDILFGLFRSDPILSMKFYRQMARKLANTLRSLHPNKKRKSSDPVKHSGSTMEESEEESEDASHSDSKTEVARPDKDLAKFVNKKKVHSAINSSSRVLSASLKSSVQQSSNPNEDAIKKFQLPSSEVLIKVTDCIYKSVFKQVGKIYLFQEYVCFESSVFGMTAADVYSMKKIDNITLSKNVLRIETKGKKHHFIQIKDQDNFAALMLRLWEQAKKGDVNATLSAAAKGKSKNISKVRPEKEQSKFITLTKHDWGLLLGGAKLISYKDGEPIIEEGKEHQRIYQIAKGRCVIKKKGSSGHHQIQLGVMESEEIFGEMTFLEKGQKATASVIADGEDVQIYIIEGYYINMTFVDHPELAGRFYCYIATVLAKRLNDREKQIQKEEKSSDRRPKKSTKSKRTKQEKEFVMIKSEPEVDNI